METLPWGWVRNPPGHSAGAVEPELRSHLPSEPCPGPEPGDLLPVLHAHVLAEVCESFLSEQGHHQLKPSVTHLAWGPA